MAYKYFFKTLTGQGERLLQSGDVCIWHIPFSKTMSAYELLF